MPTKVLLISEESKVTVFGVEADDVKGKEHHSEDDTNVFYQSGVLELVPHDFRIRSEHNKGDKSERQLDALEDVED